MNPPEYDIERYLPSCISDAQGSRSIDLADQLVGLIGMDGSRARADDELFHCEAVFLHVMHFETSMGNGFATLLNYSDGMENFARAL